MLRLTVWSAAGREVTDLIRRLGWTAGPGSLLLEPGRYTACAERAGVSASASFEVPPASVDRLPVHVLLDLPADEDAH